MYKRILNLLTAAALAASAIACGEDTTQVEEITEVPDQPVDDDEQNTNGDQDEEEEEAPSITPTAPLEFSKSMGMGWNLGNQLDAFANETANETCWGNGKTSQQLFDNLASAGISTVRIPVTWLGKTGKAPDYLIDSAWLDRVAEVVGYAEKAGLKAIINIHHDGGHWLDIKTAALNPVTNKAVKEQLTAMWTQIANRFSDKGEFLIFESVNEIHDGGWGWGANRNDGGKQYKTLNEWNQAFVDAVRATGGNNASRFLGIPCYCTNPDLAVESSFALPTDPTPDRLMISVHYYSPTDYTLEDKFKEWGHTAAKDKKDTWGDEDYAVGTFKKLKTKFIDNNIPVYIGEMGAVRRTDPRAEEFRKYYLEYICKAAKDHGLAPIYWDNGSANAGRECSGLINHATGAFLNDGKEIMELMVKAVTSTEPDYTLKSVYDKAPQ